MSIHECDTFADGIGIDHSIWVEQQHIVGIRQTNSHIVSTCKTYILLVSNKLHVRTVRLQITDGIVFRAVVDDDDFAINSLDGLSHAIDTLHQ